MPLGQPLVVRGTVTDCGGVVNRPFAQGQDLRTHFQQIGVSDAEGDDRDLRAGICKALCFEWLGSRAKGGSLWDLLDKGGAVGIFAQQQAYYQKTDQNLASLPAGSRTNIAGMPVTYEAAKLRATDEIAAEHGLTFDRRNEGSIPQDPPQGAIAVGKALSQQQGYALMTLASGNNGHAICAHVHTHAGITFFDPNYGEFFFEKIGTGAARDRSVNAFLVWMPYFWSASNYDGAFGGGSYIASFYHARN